MSELYFEENDDVFYDAIGGIVYYHDGEGQPLTDDEDEYLIDQVTADSIEALRGQGCDEFIDESNTAYEEELETDRILFDMNAGRKQHDHFQFDTTIIPGLLDDYLDGRIQPGSGNAKQIAAALREGWQEYSLRLGIEDNFEDFDDDQIVEITVEWLKEQKK